MEADTENTSRLNRDARRTEAVIEPNPRRALRLDAVLDRLGIGRSTLYEMIEKGLFPAPLKPGAANGAAIWLEQWVDDYIDGLIKARDAGKAA
jgi:predicted DNA-binding transcriptional regulator AlpA